MTTQMQRNWSRSLMWLLNPNHKQRKESVRIRWIVWRSFCYKEWASQKKRITWNCLLQLWKKHATWFWSFIVVESSPKTYPLLAHLAQKFLSIPATSVASERVFSTAGDLVTAQRSWLSCQQVDRLIFFKKKFDINNNNLMFISFIDKWANETESWMSDHCSTKVLEVQYFLFDLSRLVKSNKCKSYYFVLY